MRRIGRPHRVAGQLGTALVAAAMAATSLVGIAAPAAAADATVLASDFEGATPAPWSGRGATVSLAADAHSGAQALAVTGRTAGWNGAQVDVSTLFTEGQYHVTGWVKLVAGQEATEVNFGVNQPGASNEYPWVGSRLPVTDSAWVQLDGYYSVLPETPPTVLYLESASATAELLLDDVLVTGPPPATTVISSLDFEGGATWAPWAQSGGDDTTLAVVSDPDDPANSVLQVAGRSADYVGIESPALFQEGTEYTFSARLRLAPDAPADSVDARFVVKAGYHWVGNGTITKTGWTTLTGTHVADADDATAYLGTSDITVDGAAVPYTYLVDDVLITAPGSEGPNLPPDFVPGGAIDPTTTPVATAQGIGNVAALTFDDGPNPATTPALLDFLKANGIKATFCVIGQNIEAPGGAELLRRIVAEGHVLCNHTTSYADMGSWTPAQVQADLIANLQIIRTALSDPYAKVPFFRAPNGSWGATPQVAVDLGMQPLAVVNTISDWETQDVPTLVANLQAAMKPGEIVLAHDGGGDRSGTLAAVQQVVTERLAAGWTFTFPSGTPPFSGTVLSTDFEDASLGGWVPRVSSGAGHTVDVTDADAHGGTYAALVAGRGNQGDGIGHDVTTLLQGGVTYELTAWVRFAEGQPPDDVWLSLANTTGDSTAYSTLAQFTGLTNTGWTELTASFTMPAPGDSALLYFETRYSSSDPIANTSDFLVDDIVLEVPPPAAVQDLTPLKDTVDFPLGVAIDSRETTGSPSELLLRHADQITPENHMKVEAWYDADRTFVRNDEATALLDFAQENGLRLYGHVLVWHSQTPAWFFQRDDGTALTTSDADKQFLRDRLRTHIQNVAASIAGDYGPFGSDTNPVVGFDVVNEVISDAATPDGLRDSEWHRVLGEEYVHLAFQYADEAFNDLYAAPGVDRPVKLFINDYNTEQGGKQDRYFALVQRLLAAGTPVDGVGHQFHVSITTPVSSLQGALDRFAGLGLLQAVTELDVTLGTPVTQANLIRQGYFYRDVFAMLRTHQAAAGDLFSVTVWGLTDNRSWRSTQAPLLFDGALQAKPAYYGAAGDDEGLPALITAANVFGGDVPLDASAGDSVAWRDLPHQPLTADAGSFQARWNADHLTLLVQVADDSSDAIEVRYGDATYAFSKAGTGDVPGLVIDDAAGWRAVLHVPHAGVAQGDSAQLDVRVLAGGSPVGAWNSPGTLGTLTFLEDLSSVDVVGANAAPVVDGVVDDVWADANAVHTGKAPEGGADGAQADVRTLWEGDTLYVLYEVTDPVIDVSGTDPWVQDSVELFVDAGNAKNGGYREQDAQMRISVDNVASFGSGDATAQAARLTSATATTGTGYVVELAVDLLGLGGLDTFQGLDFQVNDGRDGSRYSVHTWAEPTGTGYQTTARWGVGHLVAAPVVGPQPPLTADELTAANRGGVDLPAAVRQPATLTIPLGRAHAREQVEVWFYSDPVLVPTDPASKKGTLTVVLPADVTGEHKLAVFGSDRELIGWDTVVVLAAGDPPLNVTPPSVSGKPAVGKTLTAKPGTWAPDAGLRYAYRWQRDGVDIAGATGKEYTVRKADAGHSLTVVVTASGRGIASATATSQPVTVPGSSHPGHWPGGGCPSWVSWHGSWHETWFRPLVGTHRR